MKIFTILFILALLSTSMALNCYRCSITTGDCNDPFNKTALGVSQTGSISANTYCRKLVVAGVVTRDGTVSCQQIDFVNQNGVVCCTTDLCNGAQANYQLSIILILCFIILMMKIF